MKPFKINRNSWHYKLNRNFFNTRADYEHYMHDNWEPRHNNFCSYWRVTMLRLVVTSVLSAVILGATIVFGLVLGNFIYNHPWDFLISVGVVVALFGTLVAAVYIIAGIDHYQNKPKKPDSLFMQKYKAHKSKICPMVEYEE